MIHGNLINEIHVVLYSRHI